MVKQTLIGFARAHQKGERSCMLDEIFNDMWESCISLCVDRKAKSASCCKRKKKKKKKKKKRDICVANKSKGQ
jgi:hypothetical protein